MADGVRIHHATLRGITGVIVDPSRPLNVPHLCSICGQFETHKTYHISFDGEGDALVSTTVLERLNQIAGATGETIVDLRNTVADPPTIRAHVGLGEARTHDDPALRPPLLQDPSRLAGTPVAEEISRRRTA